MEKLVLTQNMVANVRQSLVDGLTIASGAKSSATYYHSKDEQLKAIQAQIRALYGISKELPLIIASQKGATGTFISEVLINEFKQTYNGGACNIVNPIDWYDNGISDKAVLTALNNLGENGLPYVLRMFLNVKDSKVNNQRFSKIALGFIWGQDNLEFYAIKYRNKIAKVLKHVYGQKMTSVLLLIAEKTIDSNGVFFNEKEVNITKKYITKYFNGDYQKAFKLLLFLFKRDAGIMYNSTEFPLISEYQKARGDIRNISVIPEEVLLGLISSKKHPQYAKMWSTESQRKETQALIRKNVTVTSVNQQVRQTKSTAKLGVERTVDLEKATDFLALYKTGYENGWTDELRQAIDKLAEKKKIQGFYYKNLGILIDRSNSMNGHAVESKNTPIAIAEFTAKVLGKSADVATFVKTEGEVSDLATAFVQLLKSENTANPYDAIFIITDGYENAYDGLTNEVISMFKTKTGRTLPIFQISPITSAEMGADVRKVGNEVTTLAISNPVAIQPQISARLLEIDTKKWLENQVKTLELAPVSRTKKISTNA